MRKLTRILGVVILVTASFSAWAASPCAGVDRNLMTERKDNWAGEIARQLDFKRIGVLQTFQVGSWGIVYLVADESEPVYVFYADDPLRTRYITLWSGVAKSDEAQTIREWTFKNAPGIPRRLASCFAWYVTTKPDQHKFPAHGK